MYKQYYFYDNDIDCKYLYAIKYTDTIDDNCYHRNYH